MASGTLGADQGWPYFGNKRWQDITREERFFCLHLFNTLQDRGNLQAFLKTLDPSGSRPELNGNSTWEVGYEVCLFRDLRHHRKTHPHSTLDNERVSDKRTFDLCLFSEQTIVVIEAKAQQGFRFGQTQLYALSDDLENVKRVTQVQQVFLVGIASSRALNAIGEVEPPFVCTVSWKELAEVYGDDEIFLRAEEIYEPPSRSGANATGRMTGTNIRNAYKEDPGGISIKWVGRGGGEDKFLADCRDGTWEHYAYEVNDLADSAPNRNWIEINRFIEMVDEHGTSGVT